MLFRSIDRREDPAPASAPLGGTVVAVAERRGPPLSDAPVAGGPEAAAPEAAAAAAGDVAASASAKTSDALAAKRVDVAAAAPAASQGQLDGHLDGQEVQSQADAERKSLLARESVIPSDESGARLNEDLGPLEADLLAGLPGASSTALPAESSPPALAGGGRPASPRPGAASSSTPQFALRKSGSMAGGGLGGAPSPPTEIGRAHV